MRIFRCTGYNNTHISMIYYNSVLPMCLQVLMQKQFKYRLVYKCSNIFKNKIRVSGKLNLTSRRNYVQRHSYMHKFPRFYGPSHLFQGQTCKFISYIIHNHTIMLTNKISLEFSVYQNRLKKCGWTGSASQSINLGVHVYVNLTSQSIN